MTYGEGTALVVIDTQNDFCTGPLALSRYPGDPAVLETLVHNTSRALAAARTRGIEVVFVRFTGDPCHQGAAWRSRDAARHSPAKCLEGTWGAEFTAPLTPQPGEAVFTKRARFDAFLSDGFEPHLIQRDIGHLTLTGLFTDVCVDSTARTAFQKGFHITVLTDCTTALHTPDAQILDFIHRLYGARLTTGHHTNLWTHRPDTTQETEGKPAEQTIEETRERPGKRAEERTEKPGDIPRKKAAGERAEERAGERPHEDAGAEVAESGEQGERGERGGIPEARDESTGATAAPAVAVAPEAPKVPGPAKSPGPHGEGAGVGQGVGLTAVMVAAARAIETARPDTLAQDVYAQHFVHAAGIGWPVHPDQVPDGDADPLWGRLARYFGLRTRVFDDHLLRSAATGVRQVVLLGAGLDTRAYRLPWPRGCTVYEIDHEPVLTFKQRTLATTAATPRARRVALASDLRGDWAPALMEAGFDPGRPTAWAAEGLFLYLPPDTERRLIETLDTLSAPGSTLAYEVKHAVESAAVRAAPVYAAARDRIGVDLLALFDPEPRPDSATDLTTRGWHPRTHTPFDFTRRLGRGPHPEEPDALAANRWTLATRPHPTGARHHTDQ